MATENKKNHNWFKRSITAGAIAGLLFLIPEILLLPLFSEHTLWTFLTMAAALMLNPDQVLAPETAFDGGVVLTGLLIHLGLSLLYSILFFYASNHLQKYILILSGIFYGVFLYAINFYVFTYAFEWFIDLRHPLTIVAHLVYGLTLPLVYLKVHQHEEDRPLDVKA